MTQTHPLAPAAERRGPLDARHPAWVPMTIPQLLDRAAEQHADRPLVIADERILSYREVQEWSRGLAAGLIAFGVEAGDHVALICAALDELIPGWEAGGGADMMPELRGVVVFSPGGGQRPGATTLAQLEAAATEEAFAACA